ncbi:MAG TPA: hypothetical protein VHM16_05070 [Rubrobacteraceae bacterium]|nr:hypothetical protein [Rubrobacteraceae bacterium]
MTGKISPEDQSPHPEGFQTARSERGGGRKKSGRVSQRRELAIVTLGAVAAMTGLGGVLAANPPSWATSETSAQPAVTAQAATTPVQSASTQGTTARPSSNTADTENASASASAGARSDPEQDRDEAVQVSAQQLADRQAALRASRQAARNASRQSAQQTAPVYSAPTQAPSAVSQGS